MVNATGSDGTLLYKPEIEVQFLSPPQVRLLIKIKENIMLKGYRTYLSILLAGVAELAPAVTVLDTEVNQAVVVILLALAAYFRKQA